MTCNQSLARIARKHQLNLLPEYMSEVNSVVKKLGYEMYMGFFAGAWTTANIL